MTGHLGVEAILSMTLTRQLFGDCSLIPDITFMAQNTKGDY